MGERRKSREYALQVLYSIDISKTSVEEALKHFWKTNQEKNDDVRSFTDELVQGMAAKQEEIDELINNFSSNWKLSRMTAVDRNILRMSVYELKWCDDIPVRVTLNEAIEIAKQYGTEDSSAFINGILDQVAKQVDKL